MRINYWYSLEHDSLLQALFWRWWEQLSLIERLFGLYAYKMTADGVLLIKVPERVMLSLRDAAQDLTKT